MAAAVKPTGDRIARHYNEMQIVTAPKAGAICALHRKCIQCIDAAVEEPGRRRRLCDRAQNILAQLQSSLRMGDVVSEGLFYLYDYCYVLLENDRREHMDDAREVMAMLRDTFERLSRDR